MSCARCDLLDLTRRDPTHVVPDPLPEHVKGCPRAGKPGRPGMMRDASSELGKLGLVPPANVPAPPPTTECVVCDNREQMEDVPVGLASLLLCDDHATELIRGYAGIALRSVIPERHQPARDVPPALADWNGEDGRGVFAYGSVGTGKSWAMSALLKRLWMAYFRRHGRAPSLLWLNAATVFADLRAQMGQKHKGPDPLAAARAAWVLVLDDLGAERPSAWTAEHLYVLLNERYERMRPTLVTSNYDLGQLVGRLTPTDDEGSTRGEQLVSRLAGMTLQVPFTGPDRRVPE